METIKQVKQRMEALGILCREQIAIAPYTSFRIGGTVALLAEPSQEEQLISAVRIARESGLRTVLLGRGSNVLFADEPMSILVIRTAAMRAEVAIGETTLTATCGTALGEIARRAQRAGLGGASFVYGIPGTLGGALSMNAGAYGGQMSDITALVRIYDAEQHEIITLTGEQMGFSYRHSHLLSHPHWIALSATLSLQREDPAKIEACMLDYMQRRRDKQPLEYPSAGSIFKRPEGHFAGALIEQSGLKGYRIGGAMVSPKHAGFIVNAGDATAADVLALMQHIKDTVKRDHGVELEPEVQLLTSLGAR